MKSISRTGALRLESHLLSDTSEIGLLVSVLLEQVMQILMLPHGGEHMSSILDDLDLKVIGVSGNENHSFDAAMVIARLDKLVARFDALVDAGERCGDGVFLEDAEALLWERALRVGQLVDELLHGVLSDELAVLAVDGEVAKCDCRHRHDWFVFVVLQSEKVHECRQAFLFADFLTNLD